MLSKLPLPFLKLATQNRLHALGQEPNVEVCARRVSTYVEGLSRDAHKGHVLRSYRSVSERDMSERSILDCAGRGALSGVFCELCCMMRSSCVAARWYPTRSTCRRNASVCMPCFTSRFVIVDRDTDCDIFCRCKPGAGGPNTLRHRMWVSFPLR